MPRIYKTKGMVNEEGRICTVCHEFKFWDAFRLKDGKSFLHSTRCKECEKTSGRGQFARCRICGDWLDESDTKKVTCNGCSMKNNWTNGNVYLAIEHTGPFAKGGHFSKADFTTSLFNDVWPNGMIVEIWHRKIYVGTYEVKGREMVPVDTKKVVGDGLWLKR